MKMCTILYQPIDSEKAKQTTVFYTDLLGLMKYLVKQQYQLIEIEFLDNVNSYEVAC